MDAAHVEGPWITEDCHQTVGCLDKYPNIVKVTHNRIFTAYTAWTWIWKINRNNHINFLELAITNEYLWWNDKNTFIYSLTWIWKISGNHHINFLDPNNQFKLNNLSLQPIVVACSYFILTVLQVDFFTTIILIHTCKI